MKPLEHLGPLPICHDLGDLVNGDGRFLPVFPDRRSLSSFSGHEVTDGAL
jgi:hypothetical protein